jgi:hypothetical protein
MKKKSLLLIILLFSHYSVFALNWGDIYWTVPPLSESDILTDGASFDRYFFDKKRPTIKYEVYVDLSYYSNMEWVQAQWWQDHGWRYDNVKRMWYGNGHAKHPVRGALYIDPYEKVAIYFYPGSDCDVFRVRVLNK